MKPRRIATLGASMLMAGAIGVILIPEFFGDDKQASDPMLDSPHIAVMSVTVATAGKTRVSIRVPAIGNVAAWQEASLGAEADRLRLTHVRVDVGDRVSRGQELAVFNSEILEAELAESTAAVAQAEAEAVEADANYRRAESLSRSGALSAQQIGAYALAASSARAGLEARRATELRNRLRLSKSRLFAPSDGIISARNAAVGSVIPAGQELFRLIEDGRLEWRAEVSVADLDLLRPGQVAWLAFDGQAPLRGELRTVAPTIDTERLTGLVYVDLPSDSPARAGAFVRGHIEIGESMAVTVPQTAVLLRDGIHSAFRVGPDSVVRATRVEIGRRIGDRVEVTEGLLEDETVVASGLAFLSDGDSVRVVAAPAEATAQAVPDLVGAAPSNAPQPVSRQ
jgi:RND family efflux transporter MFP subunit